MVVFKILCLIGLIYSLSQMYHYIVNFSVWGILAYGVIGSICLGLMLFFDTSTIFTGGNDESETEEQE